jgi:AcrR family transcriptional regulator
VAPAGTVKWNTFRYAAGMGDQPVQVPMAGPAPERADAARNRHRILEAAARLLTERHADGLPIHEIAAEAGVGVGTIYRRFGDRAGLAQALLDHRERTFQAAFLSGPPPLGPGAAVPPRERIRAFLHAYADRLGDEVQLLLIAETNSPMARFDNGAYRLHRNHLVHLIAEERPGADAPFLADALLAPLAANLYLHQRAELGMTLERVKAGIDQLLGWHPRSSMS